MKKNRHGNKSKANQDLFEKVSGGVAGRKDQILTDEQKKRIEKRTKKQKKK